MPQIGEKAPDFTLPNQDGEDISLASLQPQNVVLYFYPKDDTPGCTVEALDFTALGKDFTAANTQVIGISKDTVAKHQKFIAKHSLGVTLISDADGQMCEDYGTWVEKKMYGKTFMGIERTTMLIDGTGVIRQIWNKVKVPNHAQTVLDAAKDLA